MKKLVLITLMFFTLPVIAEPRLVSVKGESEFEVDADIINIEFSIANKSEISLTKGNEKVNAVAQIIIEKLVALGINQNDIYSPSFNYQSDRDYDENECPGEYYPYVSRDMSVQLKNIEKYTAVIDLLLENGVTSIDEINSEISGFDKQNNEAMNLAIDDAKRQAKFYVESFGGKLGKVHSISNRNSTYGEWDSYDEIIVRGIRASGVSTKLQPYKFVPGPVTITASIYVQFEID